MTFTIRSNVRRPDDPWTYTVPADSTREEHFDGVAHQNGRYGSTVLADLDGTWSRRYTGHIETGGTERQRLIRGGSASGERGAADRGVEQGHRVVRRAAGGPVPRPDQLVPSA
ncbi:phospholipase domain-containing protein [Streptomyces sp. NPDC094049]|uniref:phospholipase domain-containing protein n=1 Tax=Streptomyces sp. NPDC094049 TaxID=3154987 RepID=UPI003321460E